MGLVESPIGGGLVTNQQREVVADVAEGRYPAQEIALDADGAEADPLIVRHSLFRTCSLGMAGWCSLMKSFNRA
jgi:hypothetical protein